MTLSEQVQQVLDAASFAGELAQFIRRVSGADSVQIQGMDKPYKYAEYQASPLEQITYLAADLVVGTKEEFQGQVLELFLHNKSVNLFFESERWEGLRVLNYMLPSLKGDAQLQAFKALTDIAETKSDDFTQEMTEALEILPPDMREDALNHILSKRFMRDLQAYAPDIFCEDMAKLNALLPDDGRRRIGKVGNYDVVTVQQPDTQPPMKLLLVCLSRSQSVEEVDRNLSHDKAAQGSQLPWKPSSDVISFYKQERSMLNRFFRDAAAERRDNDPELAGLLLNAARVIGKGRHQDRAFLLNPA